MFKKTIKSEDILAALQGPKGFDGDDGNDGLDGLDGKDGKQGIKGADGKNGAAGMDGSMGGQGIQGPRGLQGEDGEDGISITSTVINNAGNLIITFSDGTIHNAGRAKGDRGIQGPPGRNGGIISTGGGGGAAAVNWGVYATNAQTNGNTATIAAGEVLEYVLDAVVVYRFYTTAVDSQGYPNEDSFYSAFDGVNLTGLIATRGTS